MASEYKTWSKLSQSYQRRLRKQGVTPRKYNRRAFLKYTGFKSEYEYRQYRKKHNRPEVPDQYQVRRTIDGKTLNAADYAQHVHDHHIAYGHNKAWALNHPVEFAIAHYRYNIVQMKRMTPGDWYIKYNWILDNALQAKKISAADRRALDEIAQAVARDDTVFRMEIPPTPPRPEPTEIQPFMQPRTVPVKKKRGKK